MKISATVALAVMACAEVAMAQCFPFDFDYDKEEAKAWIKDACKAEGGMFTGGFTPGQVKSMSPKSKHDYKRPNTLFEVENQNAEHSFDLGDEDCYNSLLSKIEECDAGGESESSGWRFR